MSASQSGTFNVQEFTDLGAPLVGGRLYTYAYGTTTQKTAYTDHAGTIPHTYTSDGLGGQYIALNSRGEVPGALYLSGGSYDLALKTSAGATVWTRRADPVFDIANDLSTSSGSSLVGYLPAGTGAVATTVQSKLRESVNFDDFGTAGDGVTDDYLPLKNLIAHCNTLSAVRVTLGKGKTYYINRYMSGGIIEGTTDTWTALYFTNLKALEIDFNGSTIRYKEGWTHNTSSSGNSGLGIGISKSRNVYIHDGEIDGSCETVTRDGSGGVIEPAYWTGLSIANCENVVFENMYIHHFGRDGIDLAQSGIGFWQTGSFSRYNSNNILVKNCNVEYNGRQAYSNTGARNVVFENTKLNYNGASSYGGFAPGGAIDIEPNYYLLSSTPALQSVDSEIENHLFLNCEINKGGTGAILFAPVNRSQNIRFVGGSMFCQQAGAVAWICGVPNVIVNGVAITLTGGQWYLSYDVSTRAGWTTIENCDILVARYAGGPSAQFTDTLARTGFTIKNNRFRFDNTANPSTASTGYPIIISSAVAGSSFENNSIYVYSGSYAAASGEQSIATLTAVDLKIANNRWDCDALTASNWFRPIYNSSAASNATNEDFRPQSAGRFMRPRPSNWDETQLFTGGSSGQATVGVIGYCVGGDSVKRQVYLAAAPVTGTWARGDIVWNSAPSASGFVGWVCTASGTPGTWKTFGTISA